MSYNDNTYITKKADPVVPKPSIKMITSCVGVIGIDQIVITTLLLTNNTILINTSNNSEWKSINLPSNVIAP